MKNRALFAVAASFLALVAPIATRAVAIPEPAPHHGSAPQLAPSAFGVPFPSTHDAKAWQQWRERVSASLQSRRAARAHANGAGSSPASGSLIETVAGSVPFQTPATALQVGTGNGDGVVQDAAGNLYVATGSLGAVLKVDTSSNVTIYAGVPSATGPAVQSGDGGPATAAQVPSPEGLAIDAAGNLYISDLVSYTVRMVNASTGVIQTIAGIPGQYGHSGDGGPASGAALEDPTGLALDGNGNLFIADLQYVREINLASGTIQTVAGTVNFQTQCILTPTNSCPALALDFTMFGASTVAASGGKLFVLMQDVNLSTGSGISGAVVGIDLSSGAASLAAGGDQVNSSNPAFQLYPQSIATDTQGNLYLGSNGSIYMMSLQSNTLNIVAGDGQLGFSGDGGAATSAMLSVISSIFVSPSGSLLVRDLRRVRSFTVGGNINTVAGDGTANLYGDNGAGTQAGLGYPYDVAGDAQGNLYIAELDDFVVRRLDAVTGVITTVAGNGTIVGPVGEGGPATGSTLYPEDVALDQSGNLYIADLNGGALRVVNAKTGVLTTLTSNFYITGGMAYDGTKTLYVPTDKQVMAVDVTTGSATAVAGDPNQYVAGGDGGPALQAGIGYVSGVALDGKGNLYVSDQADSVIRVVNLSTSIIQTLAGQADQTGYAGDGGPATAATLNSPQHMAYDGAGHLDVADLGNQAIRQIDLTTGVITTLAGNGTAGFAGDSGPASGALLFSPTGVASDATGNLFIADSENNRVRRVLINPTKLNGTLTASASQVNPGDTLTFTATFSGLSLGNAPTGTVLFANGSTSLGSSQLAAASDRSGNYVATLSTTSVAAGNANITAQYSGDAHYASVTTNAVAVMVGSVTPSYTVAANPASLSIAQGASGSVTFSVTPMNGFNQAVTFSCNSATLPQGVTCSFSPASVPPSGSAAVTSTLTVSTTGASTSSLDLRTRPLPRWWIPSGGGVLALLLFTMPRSRRKAWQVWMAMLLFAVCLGGTTGCGAIEKAINGDNGSGSNANATPVGTYSISVTASAGTGTSAVSQPLTVSLTVTQ